MTYKNDDRGDAIDKDDSDETGGQAAGYAENPIQAHGDESGAADWEDDGYYTANLEEFAMAAIESADLAWKALLTDDVQLLAASRARAALFGLSPEVISAFLAESGREFKSAPDWMPCCQGGEYDNPSCLGCSDERRIATHILTEVAADAITEHKLLFYAAPDTAEPFTHERNEDEN